MDAMLIIATLFATFFAATLTVPAGFGLATMVTPVVFLWLEPHEAVAVVAIVHGAHNAWKLKLLRERVDFDAVNGPCSLCSITQAHEERIISNNQHPRLCLPVRSAHWSTFTPPYETNSMNSPQMLEPWPTVAVNSER